MDDDRRVQAVEDAVFAHIDFAADGLFGRTAVDVDRRLVAGRFGKGRAAPTLMAAMRLWPQRGRFPAGHRIRPKSPSEKDRGRRQRERPSGKRRRRDCRWQSRGPAGFFQRRRCEDFVHARFRVVVKAFGNAVDDRFQFIYIAAGWSFKSLYSMRISPIQITAA